MSDLNWAAAKAGPVFLASDEEAHDGQTPDEGEDTSGNIALVVEGCAIYGQPADLLQFLADGLTLVSAHLAGRQ